MGWTYGTDIFCAVAEVLVHNGVSDEIRKNVLSRLVAELQSLDWDTETEALEDLKHDPVVVETFRQHGVELVCGARTILWPDVEAIELICRLPWKHEGLHVDDHMEDSWDEGENITWHPH